MKKTNGKSFPSSFKVYIAPATAFPTKKTFMDNLRKQNKWTVALRVTPASYEVYSCERIKYSRRKMNKSSTLGYRHWK